MNKAGKKTSSSFGSKCDHRSVKLFRVAGFSQSNILILNQSERSPPDINILLFKLRLSFSKPLETWLVPSKLHENQLVEKLHVNSSPLKQLVRALLLLVESRNLIVTGLVRSLFVRSVVTRNPPSC